MDYLVTFVEYEQGVPTPTQSETVVANDCRSAIQKFMSEHPGANIIYCELA